MTFDNLVLLCHTLELWREEPDFNANINVHDAVNTHQAF